ncbi:hypothetical protein GINT2_000097 [Glugoides intestinalis]
MFKFSEYVEKLEQSVQPKDLSSTSILLETPVHLRMISQKDNLAKSSDHIVYRNPKNVKKTFTKSIWDIDTKSSAPGYFDEMGNYIIGKPKKISVSWLLKRNNVLEGPFTEKEFESFISTVKKEDCLVKRDFDKGFVKLTKLMEEVPMLNFKELNKFFAENQVVDQVKKGDDFFEASIINEKNSKFTNFLRNHEISASIDFITKNIKGMRKNEAVELLKDITGLDKCVNTALVDLIVENAGVQILSDVDKDGFCISTDKRKERRK